MSPRVLVLLNPGVTSRNYLIGIARAAQRMGVLAGAVELEPLWRRVQEAKGAPATRVAIAQELANLCRRECVTHVLSYTHNGVFEFGLHQSADEVAVGLFSAIGLRHILLWTDHPHWAADASGLEPQVCGFLRDPALLHVVKSESAAAELRAFAGWPRVLATTMGEDYDALTPPGASDTPERDVVLIQSDAGQPSGPSRAFLDHADPDPRDIDAAHRAGAHAAAMEALRALKPSGELEAPLSALVDALLDARIERPLDAWWRLADEGGLLSPPVEAWFRKDVRRWTKLTAAMHAQVGWRRRFWPAWLAQRADVGLYGCAQTDALPPELNPAPGWVSYIEQPSVYARGHVALNINAGHDEEGLTHKPFQIASAAAACIHHDTRGLSDAFTLGEEVIAFQRGSELLEAVRELRASPERRRALGQAMRARAMRDHTWDAFLARVLAAADEAAPAMAPVESTT